MNRPSLVLALVALAACTTAAARSPAATASLKPTQGNTASGTVTFTPKGDKVTLAASVSGLTPGKHGFHIHEDPDDYKTQPTGNSGARVACGVIRKN